MLDAALLLVLLAFSPAQTGASLHGDRAHPAHAHRWVETRLYFGLGRVTDPADAREIQWQAFLDREVTPRFPAGLSVVDVYGQWQGVADQRPQHLRSKMLIIDYAPTPENMARIEAIRAAWKQETGDRSVLKITGPVDVSF